jgi:hypothetical protein
MKDAADQVVDVFSGRSGLIPLTIGVSGHRDIPVGDHPIIERRFEDFLIEIHERYPHTPLRLITGLAEGADRIAANVFLAVRERLKLDGIRAASQWSLVAALPMPEPTYVEDFPESGGSFRHLLGRSDIALTLTTGELRVGEEDDARRLRGYQALARYVARHANILAAFWDGIYLDLPGGTSDVVKTRLGMRKRETVSNLYLDCGLVWHLPVRRSSSLADADPEHKMPVWLAPDLKDFSAAQTESDFLAIEEFNILMSSGDVVDRAICQAAFLSPSDDALCGLVAEDPPDMGDMALVQASADIVATDRERERRKVVRTMYVLAGILALTLWTGLDGVLQPVMAVTYLAITVALLVLFRRLKSSILVDLPLYYRFLSEALRVSIYARLVPCRERDRANVLLAVQPIQSLLVQQLHEIGWIREALRMDLCRVPEYVSAELAREHHEHWIETQIAYFRKSESRHLKTGGLIRRWSWMLGLSGLIAAAAVVTHDMSDWKIPALRHLLSISAAVLPALAVLLQSYGDRMVIEQQAKSAIRMQWIFGRAREVHSGKGPGEGRNSEFLQALFSEALLEATTWLVSRKSRPPSIPS